MDRVVLLDAALSVRTGSSSEMLRFTPSRQEIFLHLQSAQVESDVRFGEADNISKTPHHQLRDSIADVCTRVSARSAMIQGSPSAPCDQIFQLHPTKILDETRSFHHCIRNRVENSFRCAKGKFFCMMMNFVPQLEKHRTPSSRLPPSPKGRQKFARVKQRDKRGAQFSGRTVGAPANDY